MSAQQGSLPVLTMDGRRFSDLDGFAREFSTLLRDHTWRGNLDAFNDILRGGFGTPDGGWVLRWVNSDQSRSVLGYPETVSWLERVLVTCHSSNREHVHACLRDARSGMGPTLFDILVEIIRHHGPGGEESADGIILDLA